jgi:hypothetical protein
MRSLEACSLHRLQPRAAVHFEIEQNLEVIVHGLVVVIVVDLKRVLGRVGLILGHVLNYLMPCLTVTFFISKI